MFGAGVVLGKEDILFPFRLHHIHDGQSACQRRGGFQRIRQTGTDIGTDDQTVYHNFDSMLFIFFQLDFFRQVIEDAIGTHTNKAAFAGCLQLFDVFALSAPDNRRHNLNFRFFRQRQHLIYNLVNGLLLDFPSANRAMGHAYPGIEQTQVVVNFGNRTHGGTGVFRGGFLVNGNGRGKAFDIVHVGLFHLAQKLPRIGGKGFHIAALALCIDGIKSKGRFSRAGKAGENDQLISGDGEADIFQVMLSGPFNRQIFGIHSCGSSCMENWDYFPSCSSLILSRK